MGENTVSVVIVNFNAGAILAECVRSVLASSVPVEVVVADNGSTDRSLGLLREAVGAEPRVSIVEMGANLGFARASNRALARTTAQRVLFLNPDCIVGSDTLARMVDALDRHPEAGMAGCRLLNPDGTEQTGSRRRIPTPARALRHMLPWRRDSDEEYDLSRQPLPPAPVAVEAISGAFMLVRREALEQVGPLDEGYFMHCEDLDWCLRFARAGQGVLFVPDVGVVHHKGACSRDRPVRVLWHMHRGMIRFYRKFFRHDYPAPLFWLVAAGVGLRFAALSTRALLRGRRDAA